MGEAANYYQPGQGYDHTAYYQQQPQGGYNQGGGYNAGPGMEYQKPEAPPPPFGQPQGQQPYPPQGQQYPPQGQQPYPPQGGQQPPPYGYHPPQAGNEKYTFDDAFKVEKKKWNDLWAGILFIIFVLGFAAVSGLAISGFAANRAFTGSGVDGGPSSISLDTNTLILFAICLGLAIALSYGYVMLARAFPKAFIWVTGILNIAMALLTGIWMIARGSYGGIVFLVFGAFLAFCFWTWRKRIPFSAFLLKLSVDIARKYGHVWIVSFIGGIVAVALGAWYAVTLVAIYVKYSPGSPACGADGSGCSQGMVTGLVVFITFTMYWMSEWLKNTIHTTVSGVYGSWYYSSRNFPKDATRGAFKRCMTTSFGSISLGSLFVAIINFLRHLCSIAAQSEASQGDFVGMCVACCLQCVLSVLQWAVEFINRYAFSHIALFGKPYFAAAKDTWKMIKDRGIDALINECLIGPVLSFGALFIGYVCAFAAYVYLFMTDPPYNSDGAYTPVVVVFALLIGLQVANVFTTPLSSGIDTIFVASAWDPEVLMRDHRDLYDEMVRHYPQVQQAIHA